MYYLCFFLTCFLFFSPDKAEDALLMLCSLLLTISLLVFNKKKKMTIEKPTLRIVALSLTLSAFFSMNLYNAVYGSRIVKTMAFRLKIDDKFFLVALVIIIALFSTIGFSFAQLSLNNILKKRNNKNLVLIFAICIAEFIQLQFSTVKVFNFDTGFAFAAVNILLLFIFNSLFLLIIRRFRLALQIASSFFTIWSIANYYVQEFHGSPLFLSELENFKTALDVFSRGYSLNFSGCVIGILLLFFTEVLVCFDISNERIHWKAWRKYGIGLVVSTVLAAFLIGCVPYFKCSIEWTGRSAVNDYGFVRCLIEDQRSRMNPINCPEEYADFIFTNMLSEGEEENYPDIILIMNESFCDLECYTDISADCDYLESFYDIEGASYGHAISPNIGGCTNNTEFELLTSNSMFLLNNSAPFNYMDFSLCGSTVAYLNQLGYHTTGMHISKTNYRRGEQYPALGFQESYLGDKMFNYHSSYGNREWTDRDNYHDLEDAYMENLGVPQFVFLVTYQNHGGYNLNPDEMDTVHTTKNFGELTDDINEYLTTVSSSADAFAELIDFFRNIERPVIICMVGDHAPSLIKDLPNDQDLSVEEEIAKRVVPFVIWSNYNLKLPKDLGYTWMPAVLPQIMQYADMPLSTYYKYILDLHEELPILLSNGYYVDKNGKSGSYGKDSEYYDFLSAYYCMEYGMINGDFN